jgi:hypothetical protein
MIKVKVFGIDQEIQDFMSEFIKWEPGDNREISIKDRKFLFSSSCSYKGRSEVTFVELIEIKPKFTAGDHVTKIEGYKFNGIVKAVYKNKDGFYRVVVEHEEGWAHIFNENQLELVKQ